MGYDYMNMVGIEEKEVKLIAFHLPQFHECKENNEWWGEGFTEWTNTKKALPLYDGHHQPREPLDNWYYDLTDIDDIVKQMKMAEEYGVYGFCFYHYWFQGRLLLNKPLEILRDYSGKKLPYCFCWANESWTRTWDGSKEVLCEQTYGGEKEWEAHFLYLLSFFKDDFYIKKNNSPMLVLYRSKMIPDCDEMAAYWDRRCKEEGFSGIYIVEEVNCYQNETCMSASKGCLEFEPLYTMIYGRTESDFEKYKKMSNDFNEGKDTHNLIYSYDMLWENIIQRQTEKTDGKEKFLGAFVDWDNTARKGKNGRIVLGTSVAKFEKYMRIQKEKAKKTGAEFIFINAWNEWAEGTYLEPDTKNKFAYLEVIKRLYS